MSLFKNDSFNKALYFLLWICFLIDLGDVLKRLFNQESWPVENKDPGNFLLYLFNDSYIKIISFILIGIVLFFRAQPALHRACNKISSRLK